MTMRLAALAVRFGVKGPAGETDLLEALTAAPIDGKSAWTASYTPSEPGNYIFFVEPMPYWEPAEGKSIKDKVALVLTDLEMPEMDGFTLTRNIKQDGRFSKIPVIIHSSLTGSTNEGHVKSVGADAYIAKFVAEELAATIHRRPPT